MVISVASILLELTIAVCRRLAVRPPHHCLVLYYRYCCTKLINDILCTTSEYTSLWSLCCSRSLSSLFIFFLLSAFPTVADSVQAALQEYQAAGERVKDLKVAVVSVVLC